MRKLDEKSLGNAALHYLKRYSATRKRLGDVLWRKAQRHARMKKEVLDGVAVRATIEKVVERMVQAGYVNDVRLADAKVSSLRRQGRSARAIRFKLKTKGVPAEVIARSTAGLGDGELEAAQVLVARKKLGRVAERRQKDLAALVRAGFAFGVARKALELAGG
ncbi:MAG: regulatory protein RecX [Myxococcaceae bacterium]